MAGWHTIIAPVVTNTYYATGVINTNAPTLTNCNLAVGLMAPESGQLWVQAEPSQTNDVVVSVSVNGGPLQSLTIVGATAGGYVTVDPGVPNAIVMYVTKISSGATGTAGFVVQPSIAGFHCEITSPGDDIFANGQPQTVAGVVSPTAWVGTDAVAVASVTVNGIATTLSTVNGDGYLTFTTVTPVPVAVGEFDAGEYGGVSGEHAVFYGAAGIVGGVRDCGGAAAVVVHVDWPIFLQHWRSLHRRHRQFVSLALCGEPLKRGQNRSLSLK